MNWGQSVNLDWKQSLIASQNRSDAALARGQGAGNSRCRASTMLAREGAFPNAQDRPSRRAKRAGNCAVALRVPRKLGRPKSNAGFRRPPVARTPMPETTIHKHREFRRAKNEIRLARQWRSAPPTGDAMLAEQRDKSQFRRAIPARANARHPL